MLKAGGFTKSNEILSEMMNRFKFSTQILFKSHPLYSSNNHYKVMKIVKIDFPETLAVCIFCRMKNAYIIILFCHCFHGNVFFSI